jgi:CBS domain-containing protein
MTSPAAVVRLDARLTDAARLMGESGYRHLVVVNEDHAAVGMVSALDVLRALTGVPTSHPAAFPHLDPKTGLAFTDDFVFDESQLDRAPDGPGVLALVHDPPGAPGGVVWVESVANLRTRLADMLSLPQRNEELSRWLTHRRHLRFRTAVGRKEPA